MKLSQETQMEHPLESGGGVSKSSLHLAASDGDIYQYSW